jgi:hypothetical protein
MISATLAGKAEAVVSKLYWVVFERDGERWMTGYEEVSSECLLHYLKVNRIRTKPLYIIRPKRAKA